jgi:hypothetical protein
MVPKSGGYIALCILVVLLNLFLLIMGFGVYQSVYQKIQLSSLLLWTQTGSSNPIITLQGTNFAIEVNNNFSVTFGVQFIVLMVALITFFVVLILSSRIAHNPPISVLIRRKRIIFPLRVITLTLPILTFSTMASLMMKQNFPDIGAYNLSLSIIGLVFVIAAHICLFCLCNIKKYKHDDPQYYVMSERIISSRWWIKNKLLF